MDANRRNNNKMSNNGKRSMKRKSNLPHAEARAPVGEPRSFADIDKEFFLQFFDQ